MKNTLLSVLAIAGLSLSAAAQVEMYIEGDATNTNYVNDTYTFYLFDESDTDVKVNMYNESGSTESWIISRRRINSPASWEDYLCWGHESDQFGGVCIGASQMDMELYELPGQHAFNVADGEYGVLAAHFLGDLNDPGTYTYRYYVGTQQDPFRDSIDLSVILTPLAIEEQKPNLTVGVQPNPASDKITITAGGVSSASVQVVDVLGNIIMNSTVSGSKTIDVSEFRNGIYFVTVSSSGTRVSRKVIVRH